MEGSEEEAREVWIDSVKILACVLVVLGHFFQSMAEAGVIQKGYIYGWFIQTIYFFHVPLFFICSGYLYQKLTIVNSMKTWTKNILKKVLALGVPYFFFSTVTWLLKNLFSNTVNHMADHGLMDSLLFCPLSPYWYLYALFFLFLMTPTLKTDRMAVICIIFSIIMKIIKGPIGDRVDYIPQFISYILGQEVWFVFGMSISYFNLNKIMAKRQKWGAGIGIIFILLSIFIYATNFMFNGLDFLMGFLACVAVLMILMSVKKTGFVSRFSQYTLPVYVMHTICAAALRSIFFAAGVHNLAIHIVFGIGISFFGPIIAAEIMKRIWKLDFLLYPGKYVKME